MCENGVILEEAVLRREVCRELNEYLNCSAMLTNNVFIRLIID